MNKDREKTLVLHIGTHKTGTTALQTAFYNSHDILQANGILYPRTIRYAHFDLSSWLKKNEDERLITSFLEDSIEICKLNQIENIVLSSEEFYYAIRSGGLYSIVPGGIFYTSREDIYSQIKKTLTILKRSIPPDLRIRIVVYLRRQDLLAESIYNQIIKNTSTNISFDEVTYQLSLYLDYAWILSIWEEIFGKDSIVVRVYEREQIPDGTVIDFLSNVLGNQNDEVNWMVANNAVNENPRLSRDVFEYKRILNKINEFDMEIKKRIIINLRQISNQMELDDQYSYFSSFNERRGLLEYYRSSNERVASYYLNRTNGILFYQSEPKEMDSKVYNGLSIDKAVEIGTRLYKLDLSRLSKRVDSLELALEELKEIIYFLSRIPIIKKLVEYIPIAKKNEIIKEIQIIKKSKLFDEKYYVSTYDEVTDIGTNPIRHFVTKGWKEYRNPNIKFNIHQYLEEHPDLKKTGTNPFLHYLMQNRQKN